MARIEAPEWKSVDWAKPLEAAEFNSCRSYPVEIDRSFARVPHGEFVKLPRNAWTGGPDGGTWLFNDAGYAVGGLGPDGYEGRYRLRNTHA